MLKGEPHFSSRVESISESKTIRIFGLANDLRAQGRDIISLAVGEPDFPTHEPVIAATREALARQRTRYGPVTGEPELRSRLAEAFDGYDASNIILTNGAKQALYTLFQVLCDAGDEVIVPTPCWVSFTEQIKLAGGRPVMVATNADFQLDPEGIARAITPRTRAVLINTPHNPTGAVYTEAVLTEVARLCATRGLYLVADEAYHAFTYDDRRHVPVRELSPAPELVITVRSFSKHYNMTGFRIGFVAADQAVVQALSRMQSHLTGNVCTFVQLGALAALEMDQAEVGLRRDLLAQRRNRAYELTRALFPCVNGAGAFYLFPDVTGYLKNGETSEDLAARLLQTAGVAVVPGEAFHGPGHIRISYGIDEATLERAFDKIKEVL